MVFRDRACVILGGAVRKSSRATQVHGLRLAADRVAGAADAAPVSPCVWCAKAVEAKAGVRASRNLSCPVVRACELHG